MIGNDVVDLAVAKKQSDWCRIGFLNKIFTKQEQYIINNATDSFKAVWLLWSMKESVYKVYCQQNNTRFFAPKKFVCTINNSQNTVCIDGTTYYVTSKISQKSIHTIASLTKEENITTNIFMLKNNSYTVQHNTVYNQLKSAISNKFNIPFDQLKIEKNNKGIPFVIHPKINSISMSHHGYFGAYAFS
ncbi:4-phosphopantetheinyl transferase family protein [Aureibaculum marinum]|uniref:4-phosphopantetheinyl transferase family protein n=1 Tax=Aureibaculum marinum TaxID=2487930 RepID=A0A3N4NTG1_9FLAO|nr:4'-phosphopantetheinyl transferase superfamily protein [Aureibaculum marinum]RPD99672.1 4-phosphopantetheinyl transferase family protein [Aureibaculum marinum]